VITPLRTPTKGNTPFHFIVSAPTSVTADTSFNITVVAADAFGTASTVSVTLRTPGAQTVNVADKNNPSLTGMANVQVNSAMIIAPASALLDSIRAWDRSAIDALFAWDGAPT
jgi:hypothetical protein